MEVTNLDNVSASSPFSIVQIFLVLIILNCVTIFQDVYSGFLFILYFSKQIIFHNRLLFPAWKLYINKNVDKNCKKIEAESSNTSSTEDLIDEDIEPEKLMTVEEVEMTIEEMAARVEEIDFDGMFEEEPSLEEVKEAFGVFDENDDGFIDASELRNVLCRLSFREASEAECGNMISAFDGDKDGRIDFNDFVKLLECSFSS